MEEYKKLVILCILMALIHGATHMYEKRVISLHISKPDGAKRDVTEIQLSTFRPGGYFAYKEQLNYHAFCADYNKSC